MIPEPAIKAVAALGVSSLAAILESLEMFEGALQRIGLPMICVAGFAYAVVVLSRKYKEMADGRIEDAKSTAEVLNAIGAARLEDAQNYASALEEHIVKGAESRAELIQVSRELKEISAEQLKAQAKSAIAMERLAEQIGKCTGAK